MSWILVLEIVLGVVAVIAAFVMASELSAFTTEVIRGDLSSAVAQQSGGVAATSGGVLAAAATGFVKTHSHRLRQRRRGPTTEPS